MSRDDDIDAARALLTPEASEAANREVFLNGPGALAAGLAVLIRQGVVTPGKYRSLGSKPLHKVVRYLYYKAEQ